MFTIVEQVESKSLPEFVELATTTLVHLKERVEGLKARKEQLEREVNQFGDQSSNMNPRLLLIQVTESIDMKLEINLIFMVNNKKVVPFEVLRVVEEGGAKVMSSNFSTNGHQIHFIIHAQAFQARLGFDAKLIESRLMELIY
ncbi:hypothetical protein E3N88_00740 [Mikania micrantha]|uniref:Uncharacterized protein n=1 Tax=Mikania micrantha TaxID=192012 RepID=A0A5N6PYZ8_9ASTR|nr:hypothetical protein E3N88_00740 [Mikania micrantha]